MPERIVRGRPASPGRTAGPVFVVAGRQSAEAPAGDPATHLREAAREVARDLEGLAGRSRDRSSAAAEVLRAQALIVTDPALEKAALDRLAELALPEAVTAAAEAYAAQLEALGDAYLAERGADVREAGRLLVGALAGGRLSSLEGLPGPAVVVAQDLSPADLLSADPLPLGLVTEGGGATSHLAIVCRELGVPAVVGAAGALQAARGMQAARLDGGRGEVRFQTSPIVLRTGGAARAIDASRSPVRLMANAGSPAAARAAVAAGAAGIGLFRTEFLFLGRPAPLGEEEQLGVYMEVGRIFASHPVLIRTLDAGSDKPLDYLPTRSEPNPALGRRGLRLWLAEEALWRPQARALLRAAAQRPNLRVMVPMLAGPEEMAQVRRLFQAEARELGSRPPPLGAMIEVPAAAATVDLLQGSADFISLGTNDLAQYALAADRELEWDTPLSEFNPGVLRLVAGAIEAAHRAGIEVGACGEMAGRPEGAAFLAGAGATSLSMAAASLPGVHAVVTRLGLEGCREAAVAALAAHGSQEALDLLTAAAGQAT